MLADSGSVAERMFEQAVHGYGPRPSPGEARAWKRSIPVLAHDLIEAGLEGVEVLLEYRLPLSSRRIDAILAGRHPVTGAPSYVVVELKQWSDADLYEDDPTLVTVGGYGAQPKLHPVEQVRGYCEYILDFLPGLHGNADAVSGVAYLHNATEHSVAPLRLLPESGYGRMFTGQRRGEFMDFLAGRLAKGVSGAPYADEFEGLRAAPSRQLLAVAAEEIRHRVQFVLLDQQQLAFNLVLHATEAARARDAKTVVIVTGGPGSGKSVIALSLLGELARQGRTVIHATGSRSFTQTLRKVAGRGSPRTQNLFKYFNSFMDATPNDLDARVCDEAHRIRESSNNRWTKKTLRSDRTQVEELLRAARVPVFLLDENQVVRPNEVGTHELIRPDVAIDGWKRPWNLRGDRAIGGAPPSALWASDPTGVSQVGCIYTAQGFEYDFAGVILGADLVENFDELVRHVYKVLLTRSLIGCGLYSVDPEPKRFLSR
jgi:hypothetical protein